VIGDSLSLYWHFVSLVTTVGGRARDFSNSKVVTWWRSGCRTSVVLETFRVRSRTSSLVYSFGIMATNYLRSRVEATSETSFIRRQWFMSMGRVSLNCGHQRAYCSSPRWYMGIESHGGMILTGENRRIEGKPVPMPFCPSQISHALPGLEPWPPTLCSYDVIFNHLTISCKSTNNSLH
jgi:hypothetical protein